VREGRGREREGEKEEKRRKRKKKEGASGQYGCAFVPTYKYPAAQASLFL
jgi:hypothetical protein